MNLGHYTLDDDGEPILCESLEAWGRFMASGDRRVGDDYLSSERYGMIRISTVFLGLDHSFGDGPPLFFETMIFREQGTDRFDMPPPDDLVIEGFWGEMARWTSRSDAEAGHAQVLAAVLELGWTPAPDDPPAQPTPPKPRSPF